VGVRVVPTALLSVTCAALSACSTPTTPKSPQVSCRDTLLRLDQVGAPDFRVDTPPHALTPSSVESPKVHAPAASATYEVRYFRALTELATVNGPIDVIAKAACYSETAGASNAFLHETIARERSGGKEVSTGPLGDEARGHEVRATSGENHLIQITVEWRIGAVVDTVTVRGRDGATRLRDALALASRQLENQLDVETPSARTTASQ